VLLIFLVVSEKNLLERKTNSRETVENTKGNTRNVCYNNCSDSYEISLYRKIMWGWPILVMTKF